MNGTEYSRVAAALRDRILSNGSKGGDRLPTERELCERYQASRITIRRALDILEQEFLIQRRQGVGTFIHPSPVRRIPLLNTDYPGSIKKHAPELKRRVARFIRTEAEAEARRALQISPGDEVLEAERVDLLHGKPVATDRLFLREAFSAKLRKSDLRALDFLRRWEQVQNFSLARCTQAIEAVSARKPISEFLRVRGGEPVLKETNVVKTSEGTPVGLFVTHYRRDTFHFEATVELKSRRRTQRS